MPKPHAKLRAIKVEHGYDDARIGRIIQRSTDYVGSCMRGEQSWRISEAYAILDHFDLPHSDLPIYFTPNGQNKEANP